jgi:hypothetical protein
MTLIFTISQPELLVRAFSQVPCRELDEEVFGRIYPRGHVCLIYKVLTCEPCSEGFAGVLEPCVIGGPRPSYACSQELAVIMRISAVFGHRLGAKVFTIHIQGRRNPIRNAAASSSSSPPLLSLPFPRVSFLPPSLSVLESLWGTPPLVCIPYRPRYISGLSILIYPVAAPGDSRYA